MCVPVFAVKRQILLLTSYQV